MAENPFRILLDFRQLNFRFYKFVWMSISPRELLTINDLKDAILKKFAFERTDLLLFLRDGLLPEDENITNILRENDNVRLFFAETYNLHPNDSRIINYEEVEESAIDVKVKSPEKRKGHSDILEDSNELEKPNKKRKCSVSNGTYVFKSNSSSENISLNAVSNDAENITNADLYNFGSVEHCNSSKIKKKLKYSNDVSQKSLISEKETFLSCDISPVLEKNQSKVNFCKKKKKHRHSKDISEIGSASENEINFPGVTVAPEIKKKEHKKKKNSKRSHDTSKRDSVSETAISFHEEFMDVSEKLDDFDREFKSRKDLSKQKESMFETVTDNSEVLKLGPISFSAPSASTSSGIGDSLKTSEENQKISSEQNCSKSYVLSDKASTVEIEENNLSFSQGNNCKKKKRKRHRKRKPLSINSLTDEFNDYNLDISHQENEKQCIKNTSAGEISSRNEETSDNSKSNAFLFRKNNNCSEIKSSFLESSDTYLPSTSTSFLLNQAASPRKNNIFKVPSISNTSEDQSCSITASQNTILHPIQKKTNENSLSTPVSPRSITQNKNNCNTSNKEKSLSVKINNSSTKFSDSFSNKGINRFLDPNFSYKSFPPINSCPLVGAHIAYKVLELDASYSPVVSNYKQGIVKAVNSVTDELEIELVEPEVKEGKTGKFEVLYEDELPSCEVIKKVTLSWTSLIDPVQVI